MSLIDNIIGCFSSEELPKEPIFRAVMFGDKAVYIENVKAIETYDGFTVSFRVKNGHVSVRGEGLYLKKFCSGDVAVCGKIKSIEKE